MARTWGGARKGAGRKPSESPAVQVTVQVPEETKAWLEERANAERVSLSQVAANVLDRARRRARRK